jgi:DNA/RNA endonuclease G (NUC1)
VEIWQKLEQRFRRLAQRGKFNVVVIVVVVVGGGGGGGGEGDGVIVDVVTSELY